MAVAALLALAMTPYCIPSAAFAAVPETGEAQVVEQVAAAAPQSAVAVPEDPKASDAPSAAEQPKTLVAENGKTYKQADLANTACITIPANCTVTFENVVLKAANGPAVKVVGAGVTIRIASICAFTSTTGAGIEAPANTELTVTPAGEGAQLEVSAAANEANPAAHIVCADNEFGTVELKTTAPAPEAAAAQGSAPKPTGSLQAAQPDSNAEKASENVPEAAAAEMPDAQNAASANNKPGAVVLGTMDTTIVPDSTPLASGDGDTVTIDDGQGEGTMEIDVSDSPTGDVTVDDEESEDEEEVEEDEDTETVEVDAGDSEDEDDEEDEDDGTDAVETGDIALFGLVGVIIIAAIAGVGALVASRKKDEGDEENNEQ